MIIEAKRHRIAPLTTTQVLSQGSSHRAIRPQQRGRAPALRRCPALAYKIWSFGCFAQQPLVP
jgi:hypothetical protein